MTRKVLLVENDEFYIEVIGTFVPLFLQYNFIAARSTKEALTRVREDHPDIVIIDIDSEDADSLALAEKLRGGSDTRALPLIAITKDEALRSQATTSGFNAFIAKPFKIRELEAIIGKLMSEA